MAGFLNFSIPDLDLATLLGADLARHVQTRVNPRARRVSLRVDAAQKSVVLVRPRRVANSFVAQFVSEKRAWIARQVAGFPTALPFGDGALISVLGDDLTVQLATDARRGVWREGSTLFVSGRAEHLKRRVRDWLKDEARRRLGAMAHEFAAQLARPVKRIIIRDPRSRWGSCSRDGTLSLSWRLVLAPEHVARYVVAHEAAHLKHMNHSAAFWRTVDGLVDDATTARAWLRRHGATLHCFGRT